MEAFRRIVRLGLAGPMAGGGQYVSWVHLGDFARAIDWIIERRDLAGPLNRYAALDDIVNGWLGRRISAGRISHPPRASA